MVADRKSCVRIGITSLVPQGRLNLAQDASPGCIMNMIKSRRDD
jgi:hypothetical protein